MSTVSTDDLGLPAEPLAAGPGDTAVLHVRAKLDAQLRALVAHEPGTRAGTDPEQLHQMRVAVRRMRSVLKHAGALLGDDSDTVRGNLRWLGDALGEVRDYDVLIARLRDTVSDFDERDGPAAERLIAGFVAERGQAKRRLNRKLGTARYRRLLDDVVRLVLEPSAEGDSTPARKTLLATLRKPRKKLRKTIDALPAAPDDDELHTLRIHGKRLRYAAELARPALGKKDTKRAKELIRAAKRLQDALGEHQDAVVAGERMRELAGSTDECDIAFVAGRIAEREFARRDRARRDWPKAAAKLDAAARTLLP